MLIDISRKIYRGYFNTDHSPFISEAFIGLVENKAEKVIRLVEEEDLSMGLILGLKGNTLCSPFSAPFGGFHYRHEHLSYDIIFNFLSNLKIFVSKHGFKQVIITLPPNIYQKNMNAKFVNAFIRLGFTMGAPDIQNCMNLKNFDGTWTKGTVGQNCRRAIKNNLSCSIVTDDKSMKDAYEVILRNRVEQDREIHMTLNDILKVNTILPVDFFLVKDSMGCNIGAGVFYRGHDKIVQGIFLGDDMEKRSLGIIDFLVMNIYDHYKKMGFEYIDLGISSMCGDPNVGLIRFKEIHNCESSLRHTFWWSPDDDQSFQINNKNE